MNNSGVDTHRIELQGPNVITTGGTFSGDSITLVEGSYSVTVEPEIAALTANRVAYIRDRSIYVGAHLVGIPISASGAIVTLRSYRADCSGGALALALPAVAASNEGDRVEIIDATGNAAGNNITLNRAGSDTIRGDPSYVIASDYGVVTLRSDGASKWHVVSEVVT